jgi:hypothetical protein
MFQVTETENRLETPAHSDVAFKGPVRISTGNSIYRKTQVKKFDYWCIYNVQRYPGGGVD